MADTDEARARATLAAMQERLIHGPHAALDVPTSATPEDARTAFLELTKIYHPARFGRMSIDIQKLSNEVFLALRAAHDAIAKPSRSGMRSSQSIPALSNGNTPAAQPPLAAGRTQQPLPPRPPRMPSASPPPEEVAQTKTAPFATKSRTETPRPGVQRPTTTQQNPVLRPAPVTPRASTAMRPLTAPIRQTGGTPVLPAPDLATATELIHKGQWGEAHAMFAALVAREPSPRNRAMAAYARGREAQLAQRLNEARVELDTALQIDPELQLAKTALGELFTRRK